MKFAKLLKLLDNDNEFDSVESSKECTISKLFSKNRFVKSK